jgi:hypothetical protein
VSTEGLRNTLEEKMVFVNCLDQLIEGVRNVFLLQYNTFNFFVKEIH